LVALFAEVLPEGLFARVLLASPAGTVLAPLCADAAGVAVSEEEVPADDED
jgi:hypothetical protein